MNGCPPNFVKFKNVNFFIFSNLLHKIRTITYKGRIKFSQASVTEKISWRIHKYTHNKKYPDSVTQPPKKHLPIPPDVLPNDSEGLLLKKMYLMRSEYKSNNVSSE